MHIVTPFSQRARSFLNIDPERDWIVALIIAFILLCSIVIWNLYVFDTVASGGVIGSPPASESPVFNQSSLDAIRAVFESRAVEEQKYTGDGYHYVDPSQ